MINIFTAEKKIQKDRKVMRATDQNLAERSIQGSIGFAVMFIVTALLADLFEKHAAITLSMGVLIIATNGTRTVLVAKFDQLHAKGPNRWRNIFFLLTLIAVSSWSSYFAFAILNTNSLSSLMVGFIFTSGMAAVVLVVCSAFLRYVQSYISILLLPLALTSISLLETQTVIIGLMLFGYWAFLIMESRPLYESYWDRMDINLQLKKKAYDLEISKTASEKSNHVKDEFLSNLNYELKTPLNSLLGMLSLLGDTSLTKEQKEFQSIAMRSGESLLALINDILDYSQITTNTLALESVVFNPRKLIEDCLDALGPMAHSRGLELVGIFSQELPTRVRSDTKRIAQIINNLVTNAITHTHQGEILIKATMNWLDDSHGELKVEVTDQGVGIDQERQAEIFNAFTRLKTKDTEHTHSTGLGLSIAKGLARNLEGDIGVISDTGMGSTFWMTAKVLINSQRSQSWQVSEKLENKRALLINLPTYTLENIKLFLKECSITTNTTSGFEEALIEIEREEYEIAIINMIAPDSSTYDFSTELSNKHPEIKQIILSSLLQRGSSLTHKHENDLRNTYFITKPVRQTDLYFALCRVFNIDESDRASHIEQLHSDQVNNQTVLLVEDNQVNRMVACKMLEKLGFNIKLATNGNEALGMLYDHHDIGIILMDCQMPELDGYETTRIIRERENEKEHIPIIAMTANAMEGDEARCLAAGMDDYLAKPVNKEELRIVIKRWIRLPASSENQNSGAQI